MVRSLDPLILIKGTLELKKIQGKVMGMIRSRKQILCEAGLTWWVCCSPDRADAGGIWERSAEWWETGRAWLETVHYLLSVGEQGHCSGYYSHGNPSLRILWKQKVYMDSKVTGQVLGREIRWGELSNSPVSLRNPPEHKTSKGWVYSWDIS